MAQLIYSAITSLDGHVADEDGNFDWSVPDDEVRAVVNELMRTVGTQLEGRRFYGVMLAWETLDTTDQTAVSQDFAAIWGDSDKVVFSTTLPAVSSARTRIERSFDPLAVARLTTSASRDLLVGGSGRVGRALEADLVDEIHLLVSPVVVGGGTRALPDGLRLTLELRDERRFRNGVVHLHYAAKR